MEIKALKFQTFIAILSVLLLSNLTALADTQIDNQNSTADAFINVLAPSSNSLYLKQNPSFTFADTEIKQQNLTVTANGTSPFQIVNLTGTNTNYKIQEQISNFTASSISGNGTVTLPVSAFYLTVENSSDGHLTGCQNVNIFGQAGQVLTTTTGGNSTGTLTSGNVTATMNINGTQSSIQQGTYNATLTTTLVSGV